MSLEVPIMPYVFVTDCGAMRCEIYHSEEFGCGGCCERERKNKEIRHTGRADGDSGWHGATVAFCSVTRSGAASFAMFHLFHVGEFDF
jgi:hypothetical protein